MAQIDPAADQTRVFSPDEIVPLIPGLYLWDLWPVRANGGAKAVVAGAELWMALSASAELQPWERHDVASIRLISQREGAWSDHGPVFPEGASAGSREWAGCARLDHDGRMEVLYTAAGRRAETVPSFVQRIVWAEGRLDPDTSTVSGWSPHQELITPDDLYASTRDQDTGEPGFIKAFRDPFRFSDPRTGEVVVLFTASMLESSTDFDGAIGMARGGGIDGLVLHPPLLTADGVNNELERPHIVYRDDRYYLFFSTQARTFHPAVAGVTGLYGFVAEDLEGEWEALNGSGLVLSNPAEEPFQAYSWLVLDDLSVSSFVDAHNLGGRQPGEVESAGLGREFFGGTLAPMSHIEVDGGATSLRTDA